MKQTKSRATSVYQIRGRWYRVSVDPFYDEDGQPAGAVHIFSDIDDQRAAELKLKEREELYRSLIEALPHAVVIIQDSVVVFANETTVSMFRFRSIDEVIGRDLTASVPEGERVRLFGYIKARMSGEGGAPPHYFTHFTRNDGDEFPAEVFVNVVSWGGRPAEQVIAIDISQRKALGR